MGIKDERKKEYRIRPYGDLNDLQSLFSDKAGDVVSPFDGKDKDFGQDVFVQATKAESDKKPIDISKLFGSHKTVGLILKKQNVNKLGYDYERVFGEKHRKRAEEKLNQQESATASQ